MNIDLFRDRIRRPRLHRWAADPVDVLCPAVEFCTTRSAFYDGVPMASSRLEIGVWNWMRQSYVKRHKSGRTAWFFFFVASCCFGGAEAASGQANSCDPSLKQPSGDSPNAYKQRSDRCEGIYAREVAGDVLLLGSLTESFDDFSPTSGGRLRLSWRSPGSESVHLRVYSLRPHFYYRMDSAPPSGRGC